MILGSFHSFTATVRLNRHCICVPSTHHSARFYVWRVGPKTGTKGTQNRVGCAWSSPSPLLHRLCGTTWLIHQGHSVRCVWKTTRVLQRTSHEGDTDCSAIFLSRFLHPQLVPSLLFLPVSLLTDLKDRQLTWLPSYYICCVPKLLWISLRLKCCNLSPVLWVSEAFWCSRTPDVLKIW